MSSGAPGVLLNSTVLLDKSIHRPCPEVEHVWGLPNRTLNEVTLYQSLWVDSGFEWYEEIHRNRKLLTTWTCLVSSEWTTYPRQTRTTEGQAVVEDPGVGTTMTNVSSEPTSPVVVSRTGGGYTSVVRRRRRAVSEESIETVICEVYLWGG